MSVAMSTNLSWSPPHKRDNTTPSCAICQRRKVKCDRNYPCAPCVKIGLECTFRPPNQHRAKRRRRSSPSVATSTLPNDAFTPAAATTSIAGSKPSIERQLYEHPTPVSAASTARLLSCSGGYRYVNNHLWHSLPTSECHHGSPGAATTTPTASTPSTLHTPTNHSTESGYESATRYNSDISMNHFPFNQLRPMRDPPQLVPGHVVQLWQIYLERIDPMMKVFHSPSVQQIVLGQIGKVDIQPTEQALVSAIHLIATVSLTDHECQTMLQESRANALLRLRRATEAALSVVGFVTTTNISVLQALVLYLAALRSLGDPSTVWSMLGLTIRIAGMQGLARDGSIFDLPPFEVELRRRLWWAILYMDGRTAELVGQDDDLLVQKHDVKKPSNLNDSDLFPGMKRLPDPKTVSTEVLYVQFRATLGSAIRSLPLVTGAGGAFKMFENPSIPLSEKVDVIRTLEVRLEDEILRGCDPGVPLQLFTMNSVHTFLNKIRLIAHIPLTYVDDTWTANSKFSEQVFELSAALIQLQLDLWSEPCLQRWRWHWQGQFQWFGLACLIRQSRLRQPGAQTTKAWAMIRNVFDTILPTLELGVNKSPLIVGVQALFNAAATAQPLENQASPLHGASIGVQSMQTSRSALSPGVSGDIKHTTTAATPRHDVPKSPLPAPTPTSSHTPVNTELDFDFEAVDWAEFDRLTAELCQQEG